jgi:aryl sulfotransferase
MPWVDIRLRDIAEVAARLEAMTHRRSMKSHTPLDGLPISDQAQYICVFRHPLDAHFSFRNHARNIPLPWFDHWYPEGDEDGIAFKRFLDGGPEGFDTDLMPLAHILRHYKAALALSDRPNVTLFHYADMSADLRGTFDSLQRLLGTDHSADLLDRLTEAASFDNMKQHAARYAPGGGTGFMRSDADFFHKGTSGNWHGQLSEDELWAYDDMMAQHLSPNARAWLEFGSTGTARRA